MRSGVSSTVSERPERAGTLRRARHQRPHRPAPERAGAAATASSASSSHERPPSCLRKSSLPTPGVSTPPRSSRGSRRTTATMSRRLVDLGQRQGRAGDHGARRSCGRDRRRGRRRQGGVRRAPLSAGAHGERPVRGQVPALDRLGAAADRQEAGRDRAHKHGADAVAHGCTGKGNDQVRFEIGVRASTPASRSSLRTRTGWSSREEEIEYARRTGSPSTTRRSAPTRSTRTCGGAAIEAACSRTRGSRRPRRLTSSQSMRRRARRAEGRHRRLREGHPGVARRGGLGMRRADRPRSRLGGRTASGAST